MQVVWRCLHACVHVRVSICVCACVECSRTGGSLSAGTRWGVTLQVPWVAVRLDSEQMLAFLIPPALHLSLGDPEVFTGGPAQALDLRLPEVSERKSK